MGLLFLFKFEDKFIQGTGNREDGTWKMEHGRWNMENGTWKMEMEHGKW